MAYRGRIDLRLASRVLLLQLVLVTLTLVVAFALFAQFNRHRLDLQYGVHALDIARVVASSPTVLTNISRYDQIPLTPSPALVDELATGPLQSVASRVEQRTHVLFVVIANNQGIRLAHPRRDELGGRVSTDPAEALAGHEQVVHQSGTLGRSIVAKVPVVEPGSNRVLGMVSVGISTKAFDEQFSKNLRVLAPLGGAALLIGVAGSVALARRWRGLTLGLRPTEMAELVRTQAAVLHGIGEGVLAADETGNITFVNDEACRLLEIGNDVGRRIDEIGLTPRVLDVFTAAEAAPTLATVGQRIVVASARKVSRDGRELGTVLVVRDRTDVESLTRQLDAVQVMSTALRAQRHEFANRLHLLNGLLHTGHVEQGLQYLEELLGSGPLASAVPGIDTIRDTHLQAFLAAKAAAAREAGVTLRIGENTWITGRLELPVDVTTVVGNLLDNAIDAARVSRNAPREVEIELLQEGSTLHVTVADSGDGVAPEFVEQLFTEGTTTKQDSGIPGGRGIGLALSRQISRSLGGDLWLSSRGDPASPLRGAEFIARLPGVLAEEGQWVGQT
ncbi:histidine kinase-, DNA gyrase B-, and HSP90-like ATPase family protein [Mycobacterium kansasii 732]|uniref:sensor histidine kinase n=1 Tax=Mycobacterium pseudokansasii TaxID=2341080 RepID=UPI000453906F|nr:ATP-binding protein [Mycobacterium pseudokansasii]EUA06348.1 histidine kinase-, DNA gyrase B-, and HSP90-like ATPase family protein [Mycobacterium kansasii 732]MBY0390236.1 Spo0B domain-containing protein [Mycobacterium pseudokansasii]VAZ95952.1 Sensor histidine kinase DcuS [Mycobacterium pseudokansasii]VAZ97287.1 Sensor histidine kinase DcuS [Mycobacterium pseudokansasii]